MTASERTKKWREENRERYNAYARANNHKRRDYKKQWARKHRAENRAETYARQRAWRKANPEKIRMYYDRVNAKRHQNIEKHRENERAKARLRFFRSLGITSLDYDRMFFQQEGRCWICSAESATHKTSPEKRLVVDHDHVDGTVRGLLCQKCNKALGLFNDDLSLVVNAVHYLTKHAKEAAA
jgi:hypothetical protein